MKTIRIPEQEINVDELPDKIIQLYTDFSYVYDVLNRTPCNPRLIATEAIVRKLYRDLKQVSDALMAALRVRLNVPWWNLMRQAEITQAMAPSVTLLLVIEAQLIDIMDNL